jgi:hypothetical protein
VATQHDDDAAQGDDAAAQRDGRLACMQHRLSQQQSLHQRSSQQHRQQLLHAATSFANFEGITIGVLRLKKMAAKGKRLLLAINVNERSRSSTTSWLPPLSSRWHQACNVIADVRVFTHHIPGCANFTPDCLSRLSAPEAKILVLKLPRRSHCRRVYVTLCGFIRSSEVHLLKTLRGGPACCWRKSRAV